MSWLTLIKYGAPALALIGLLLAIDDNGYARGRNAANTACVETVKAAKKEVQDKCDATAKQSKELSHALQSNLNTINARYYSLLKAKPARVQPSATAGAASGDDGTPGADQSSWFLTLDQRYLNDKQAAQLVSCQATITTIYKTNGREDLLPH